eukprot:6195504-Pleurochrysis_carterae.AAC.1
MTIPFCCATGKPGWFAPIIGQAAASQPIPSPLDLLQAGRGLAVYAKVRRVQLRWILVETRWRVRVCAKVHWFVRRSGH